MFKALINHISNNRHFYLWPVIGVVAALGSMKSASWLGNGKPVLDDPHAIAAYGIACWPVFCSLFWTACYSMFLNNSLTKEQYAVASPASQFVDNQPELIVFLAILLHLHFS